MTTSTQTQLRRGTSSQVAAMTPAIGEAVVNTTDKCLHVGDGTTAGGAKQASKAYVDAQITAVSSPARYSSGNQAITAYGSLTLAHGLGAEPKFITTWLKCVTAEQGYGVGDKLLMPGNLGTSGSSADVGHAIVADATNLTVRYGAGYVALNKSSGAGVVLTDANWNLVVEAMA